MNSIECSSAFVYDSFFSRRSRHTRSKRDWSSDVCSSDLYLSGFVRQRCLDKRYTAVALENRGSEFVVPTGGEIGRASCREREVDVGVVAVVKREELSCDDWMLASEDSSTIGEHRSSCTRS